MSQSTLIRCTPQEAGLAPERLARIRGIFEADVAAGVIPGAVALIARRGAVAYFESFGYQDRERGIAMPRDAIFWLASMTKPLVSVALMTLLEEGRIVLSDPVCDYLPEFRRMQVGGCGGSRDPQETRMAQRAFTIHDLLRHTSGIGYGSGSSPLDQAYLAADLFSPAQTNAELVRKLAALPLLFEPGTTFEYGMSTDVLGRLIEVVSGRDLDTFMRERICDPLQMRTLAFDAASPERAARLAEPQIDPVTGVRPATACGIHRRPNWLSGGGGMVGSARDYLRFCQMLLNGGELDGERVLSPQSVRMMTQDHLPTDVVYGPCIARLDLTAPTPQMAQRFGLGFAIRTHEGRNPAPGSVGEYHWAGAFGTYFWVDPREQLIAILMMQAPAQRVRYRAVFRSLVYQSLVH